MTPTKKGQIVKFHTPLEYEDPKQLFIILEFIEDGIKSRGKIQPINTGMTFNPIHLVRAEDLEVVEGLNFKLDEVLPNNNKNLFNCFSILG
jgi:hypothetical protein